MRTNLALPASTAHARETIGALQARAGRLATDSLPRIANTAERAGRRISELSISTSRSLARELRRRAPAPAPASIFDRAAPLARSAGQFAMRNPALLAAAGIGLAALGYAAWRLQRRPAQPADNADDGAEPDAAPR